MPLLCFSIFLLICYQYAPPDSQCSPYKSQLALGQFLTEALALHARIWNTVTDRISNSQQPVAVLSRDLLVNLVFLFSYKSPSLLYFSTICPVDILDYLS